MLKFACVLALTTAAFCNVSGALAADFTISPLSFDFGNVAVGDSRQVEVHVTNTSDTQQTLNLAGGASSIFGGSQNCQGRSLAPNESCSIFYTFNPNGLGGESDSAFIEVNGQAAGFKFTGSGIEAFRISPTGLDFGNVPVGSAAPSQQVTVTNTSHATQTINIAGGASATFGGSQNCQGTALAPGASCFVQYSFTPSAEGTTGDDPIFSINGQTAKISLSGTGGAGDGSPFHVLQSALDFGNVPLGQPLTQQIDIVNTSSTPQTVNISGGALPIFGGAQNCQGVTLAPGQGCSIFYTFKPDALGDASASTQFGLNGFQYNVSAEGAGILPFLITDVGFDFGEIDIGQTSFTQEMRIYNVSDIDRIFSFAGGGVSDQFVGSQNCVGAMIAAGGYCSIFYQFDPTVGGLINRTTEVVIDGIDKTISFQGIGIDPNGTAGGVPEPATWLSMIVGFGLVGGALRARQGSSSSWIEAGGL